MSGEYRTIRTADGEFRAYVAGPDKANAPAVVVLQEIFGVNKVMRDITDGLAGQGFLAICPDLFWRIHPNLDITDQSKEEWDQALSLMNRFDVDAGVRDIQATIDAIRPDSNGKVGTVGFCLGGLLAFLSATRTDTDAAISYYGVGLENRVGEKGNIKKPLMLHIADEDAFSSKAAQEVVVTALKDNPLVTIHIYPGRNHAFARPGGEHYDEADARLAAQRSLDFFRKTL
jgi:carboxymethylenebutenolidase